MPYWPSKTSGAFALRALTKKRGGGESLPIGGSLCFSLLRRRVESKAEEADEGEAETSKAFRAALTLNGVFEQTLPLIVHCVDANIFSSSSSSTENWYEKEKKRRGWSVYDTTPTFEHLSKTARVCSRHLDRPRPRHQAYRLWSRQPLGSCTKPFNCVARSCSFASLLHQSFPPFVKSESGDLLLSFGSCSGC